MTSGRDTWNSLRPPAFFHFQFIFTPSSYTPSGPHLPISLPLTFSPLLLSLPSYSPLCSFPSPCTPIFISLYLPIHSPNPLPTSTLLLIYLPFTTTFLYLPLPLLSSLIVISFLSHAFHLSFHSSPAHSLHLPFSHNAIPLPIQLLHFIHFLRIQLFLVLCW